MTTREPLTVEELERQWKEFKRDHPTNISVPGQTTIREALEFAKYLIESHSRQLWLEAPWISVGERLPEAGLVVLGLYIRHVLSGPYKEIVMCYHRQGEGWCVDRSEPKYQRPIITHWMPLPNPPKAESIPKPSPALPAQEKE